MGNAKLFALAISICLIATPGAPARAAAGGRLIASGCSVSNVGYLSNLAGEYQKLSGVKMFVRGGGSVIGLEDLSAGKADFAAACRGRLPDDPADLEFIQVAWDALVFIVHPSNPIDTISSAQVTAIYRGTLLDWKRLGGPAGPIKVFLQRPTKGLSGVESSLRSQVLQGQAPVAGTDAMRLASTGIVEQLVEKTPGGFGTSGYASARKRAVKMLALDGVKPTRETIVAGTYPLRRPLYLIVKKPVPPAVKAFVDFALGPKGQGLISATGTISVGEMK